MVDCTYKGFTIKCYLESQIFFKLEMTIRLSNLNISPRLLNLTSKLCNVFFKSYLKKKSIQLS